MNEMILTTAALLLLLFCLWFSAGIRRSRYFPLPGGAACFCSPRAAYLGMVGVLTLSAAVSLAGTVCSILLPNGGASFVLRSVFCSSCRSC